VPEVELLVAIALGEELKIILSLITFVAVVLPSLSRTTKITGK
jgi:hypothetical protein